jgi:hypothetical protein
VPRTSGSSRRLSVAAVARAAAALALVGLANDGPPASASASCGSSTIATIATADATVLTDIYRNEQAGTEVSFDSAQITGAHDLLSAVANDNRTATGKAVKRIVLHPAWHIVRLRVLDDAGHILADIGGTYTIAPVSGVLRLGGRVIGTFVMSVQDDVGVTKLETRFVGDPIGIYVNGELVADRYAKPPSSPPRGPSLTLGRVAYRVVTETYDAFPTGTLTAVLLVPPPAASLIPQTCSVVRAEEFGRVAARLARLAVDLPQHYHGYATTVHIYTGAEVFVRDGTKQLTSSGGSGPTVLPTSGTLSYQGVSWLVFSFDPSSSTRAYLLIPPA